MRESHRIRTVFRKAGGFVYLISALISMEGCLDEAATAADGSAHAWHGVDPAEIYRTIRTILSTLTISMRYEPANAKFFECEVRWKSLCDALKLLGCFEPSKMQFERPRANLDNVKRGFDIFESFFQVVSAYDEAIPGHTDHHQHLHQPLQLSPSVSAAMASVDRQLLSACYIMRYLYLTATDSFDK